MNIFKKLFFGKPSVDENSTEGLEQLLETRYTNVLTEVSNAVDELRLKFSTDKYFDKDNVIKYLNYLLGLLNNILNDETKIEIYLIERNIREIINEFLPDNVSNIYFINTPVEYEMFTIPVRAKSKDEARDSLSKLMISYKEDITFDETTGKLFVDNNPYIPNKTEFCLTISNYGLTPEIEELGDILSSLENSILPQVVENDETKKVVEIIYCDSISGGAMYKNNMPEELSLVRTLLNGSEYKSKYRQVEHES